MKKKKRYRVSNWKSYNKSLVKRGDLTLWFDEESIKKWHECSKSLKRGHPKIYGDAAIQCLLTIKSIYKLPLRATQGMGMSIAKILGLDIKIPDYSTLSRRQKKISVPHINVSKGPMHIVFDSTGLKVFGDGEWNARQHGPSKRRTWRKLHLGINEKTGEIVSSILSTNNVGDGEVLCDLLDQVDGQIKQVSADGAYDSHKNYKILESLGAKVTIPPVAGAVYSGKGFLRPFSTARNRNISMIKILGKKNWKKISGYHRRSLAETGMMRFKKTFGDNLSAINFDKQASEAFIKCRILNKMIALGKPQSYEV